MSSEPKAWRARLLAVCRVSDPAWLRFGRSGSIAFLIAGCLAIVAWHGLIPDIPTDMYKAHRLGFGEGDTASRGWRGMGFVPKRAVKYWYFLYYTGRFPITTERLASDLVWEERAARRMLEQRGVNAVADTLDQDASAVGQAYRAADPRLEMEDHSFLTTGDLAKVFLLYPDVWLHGVPREARLRTFNRLLGAASLLALFVSLSLIHHRLLGSVLVAVLASNPFQWVELYYRNNVFGYPIAVASLMLALHAPMIFTRWRSPLAYLVPLVSGVFLACVREVRTEPALVILSVAGIYLFLGGSWTRRGLLIGVLALSFATTTTLWERYWSAKFQEAHNIVTFQGGKAFDGAWNAHHAFWHSIWCGLGDFGQEHGFHWYDKSAYRFAVPKMNRRFGTDYKIGEGHRLLNYYTSARKHRIKPETLPEYSIVLRERVLRIIRNRPLWYAGVLGKRVVRVFTQITPIRLRIGAYFVDVPFSAWLFIPAFLGLAVLRSWSQLKFLAFYLPTSLSSILVYSGHGMTYNAAFHLSLFAVVVCWLTHAATALVAGGRGRLRAGS